MFSQLCASPRIRAIASPAIGDGFATLQTFAPPAKARADFADFVTLLGRVAQAAWPVDLGEVVAWRRARLDDDFDNFVTRAADLDALERIATTYPSRERFLSELTLDPPDATSDEAGPPPRGEASQ